MSTSLSVSELNVYRRLSDGRKVLAGRLAQNSAGALCPTLFLDLCGSIAKLETAQ